MTTFVHSEFQSRELGPLADHSSCRGRSVADTAAAFRVRDASVRAVRRRMLEAQLSRLRRRMDEGLVADTADRVARLVARLKCDDLDW